MGRAVALVVREGASCLVRFEARRAGVPEGPGLDGLVGVDRLVSGRRIVLS